MDSEKRHQLELLPQRAQPHVEPVTPELIQSIRRRSTFLGAWNFAQDFAALEDKQCYQPLQIDSSHWTKIRKGHASPPGDQRFSQYLDVVQNEIPLIWWAESRGYDWTTIRKHRSDQEKRIAVLEQENRDLRRSMTLWVEAQQDRG
jgi:hypothetical protein